MRENNIELKISNFKKSDYPHLISLWKSSDLPIKPYGRDSLESLSKSLMSINYKILTAKNNNVLVGSIVVTDDCRKGWINRLAVDKNYRNSGIASKLIEAAEYHLKKRGIKVFASLIEENNYKSQNLFIKLGYSEYKNIKYYTKRESDLI